MRKFFGLFLIILFVASCKSKENLTLYQEAMKNLKVGNYGVAAEKFEQIEDIEPFTEDANNGLIMASYSYYKAKEYEDSIRIIDYFIQSNPLHENLDYLLYLKGLDYYNRVKSSNRARDLMENARYVFNELIYKYPNTEYSKDAKIKLQDVDTYMSGNELVIANFYLNRKNYIGAINHYVNILNNFPNSKYIPESLYRLIEINLILNVKFDAVKYYELIVKNFPDNKWTKESTKLIKKYESK